MEKYRAIDWAVDALQAQLDELSGGYEYDQTLEAIQALLELKKEL